MNSDGHPDIVVSTMDTNGNLFLDTLLGNGTGNFQTAKSFQLTPAGAVTSVAVADINKDGKPDVVLSGMSSWSPWEIAMAQSLQVALFRPGPTEISSNWWM
jgi:FG-GAP-like repeat